MQRHHRPVAPPGSCTSNPARVGNRHRMALSTASTHRRRTSDVFRSRKTQHACDIHSQTTATLLIERYQAPVPYLGRSDDTLLYHLMSIRMSSPSMASALVGDCTIDPRGASAHQMIRQGSGGAVRKVNVQEARNSPVSVKALGLHHRRLTSVTLNVGVPREEKGAGLDATAAPLLHCPGV